MDRSNPESATPACEYGADVCRRNCNRWADHVVRHRPAVNNRPASDTVAGTGTCGVGDGTSLIASQCALGGGDVIARLTSQRPRSSLLPPRTAAGMTSWINAPDLAREIDSGCRPGKRGIEPASHAQYVARFLSRIARTPLRATGRACICERHTGRIDATQITEPSSRIARGPHRSRRISALVGLDTSRRQ